MKKTALKRLKHILESEITCSIWLYFVPFVRSVMPSQTTRKEYLLFCFVLTHIIKAHLKMLTFIGITLSYFLSAKQA